MSGGREPGARAERPAGRDEPALASLARLLAEDPFEADEATLSILRDGVIDTLGCIHAGAQTDIAERARSAAEAMEAPGPVPVIGADMRASRPQAAFLNAVAGHALDFDDWEIPGNTHPTIVILPALLSVSGAGTSGRDLARAYLAGFEAIARLGEALNFAHYDRGWHTTATLGAVGAAAAAARLLGCGPERMAAAMSFAVSAATGYTCQFGSNAKPVQAGFAARAGVEAAHLAAAGMTAQAHVLDHPRGMNALMADGDHDRLRAVMARPGGRPALAEHGLVLKPWPNCGYTHRAITCAIRIRERLGGRAGPDRIARIDLRLPDFHARVLPFHRPESGPEALFSLPFAAAMALARGGLSRADIEAGAWADPDVAALMGVARAHPFRPKRPELNYSEEDPDRVEVTLADGERIEEACAYPLGAPQAPMGEERLWGKFAANAGPMPEARLARLRDWPAEPRAAALLLGEDPGA